MLKLASTFVSEGTLPVGGTCEPLPLPAALPPAALAHHPANHVAGQMLGIPDTDHVRPNGFPTESWAFPPPCYEPRYPDKPLSGLSEGRCSGQWMNNITIYDQLVVPAHLAPGKYVLGLRWDCETSAQIWQSCADVTISAGKKA